MLARSRLGTPTTSMGRLFDGVSAILGVCAVNTHQAQAPQMLEWIAEGAGARPWPVEFVDDDGLLRLDWRPMIRSLVEARAAGAEVPQLAAAFHDWVATAALRLMEEFASGPVALTGGVFCNRRLTETLLERGSGHDVRVHAMLPPTDGSLSAGQVWAAACRLEESRG
jgi:hydrogenase maturation protein HypF